MFLIFYSFTAISIVGKNNICRRLEDLIKHLLSKTIDIVLTG